MAKGFKSFELWKANRYLIAVWSSKLLDEWSLLNFHGGCVPNRMPIKHDYVKILQCKKATVKSRHFVSLANDEKRKSYLAGRIEKV